MRSRTQVFRGSLLTGPYGVAFILLVLSNLVIGLICTFSAAKWVNEPFPGFLLNQRMALSNVGHYEWTGTRAGLAYPDRILSANGREVPSITDLRAVVAAKEVGASIDYAVARGEEVLTVSVPTMIFSMSDFLISVGNYIFVGVIYLLLGVVVILLKPDSRASHAFFLACFFLSLNSATNIDMVSSHLGFTWLYLLTGIFIPAAGIHLGMLFPDEKKFLTKRPSLQLLPYAFSALIATPVLYLYPGPVAVAIYSNVVPLYGVAAALVLTASVLHSFVRGISAIVRQRAKVVLFGTAIAFPLPTVGMVLSNMGATIGGVGVLNNFFFLPFLFFPTSIAYAISRHNLFDVDVYIKRAVGYALMTAIVGSTYVALQLLLGPVVLRPAFGQYADSAYAILFALIVVFLFNPVNQRVQAAVDRLFYRKKFDYRQTVKEMSNALTSIFNLDEIIEKIIHTAREVMFIDSAGVILLDSKKTECSAVFIADDEGTGKSKVSRESLSLDDPFVRLMNKEKKLVTEYDVAEDTHYQMDKEAAGKRFSDLATSLAVPFIYKGEVAGILALGHKKSGHFYDREDINLLDTLTSQGAIAIENARLFQENLEKQRMEEELQIARDLQMSMLPAECPQVNGFEIAALSTPAKEVGGDFFDFIEMGDEKLGVVVADVTGKSVSGALVMSASRSVFRMLSEEDVGIGGIMSRANRRLKNDVTSGMFVALLYAVVDGAERSLRLCSAGQTQPVHISAKTGETKLVETKGDTFPLGILPDVAYEETQLQLDPGDTVILYTDGIVEAMDEKEEIFGFDRLMDMLRGKQEMSAKALLQEILGWIEQFSAGTEQHDDLTVIVLKAH